MKIRGLCLIVLCVAFYTVAMVMYFQNKLKSSKKPRKFLPPKLIILVSQPRSGSTFLGNIISKSLQSVYFYEPLYRLDSTFKIDINFAVEKKRSEYDTMAGEYLQKVFTCDFTDRDSWHKIFDSPFKVLSSDECKSKQQELQPANHRGEKNGYTLNRCLPYFNANQIQRNCKKMNLMVKLLELRIPYGDVFNLQYTVDAHAKYRVLYLVRDPRAAFLSLLKTGWVSKNAMSKEFEKYVGVRCEEMARNVKQVRNKEHFEVIR